MIIRKESEIRTEEIKTQGLTGFTSFEVDVPATVGSYTTDIVFPIDINLIRGKWFNKVDFQGDSVEFHISPNTVIGVITANVAQDDTIINVSQTVVDNLKVGYYVACQGQDWGRVINVDADNNQITIENPANPITATGSEYVIMTIKMVNHIYLEGTDTMMTLEGGVQSNYIPANTVMKIVYNNDTGTAKKYSAIFEYFY